VPRQVQFDNARELAGWGASARTLSRVIRLCPRLGVEPVFIPETPTQHRRGLRLQKVPTSFVAYFPSAGSFSPGL
jgi:hypothetical protein